VETDELLENWTTEIKKVIDRNSHQIQSAVLTERPQITSLVIPKESAAASAIPASPKLSAGSARAPEPSPAPEVKQAPPPQQPQPQSQPQAQAQAPKQEPAVLPGVSLDFSELDEVLASFKSLEDVKSPTSAVEANPPVIPDPAPASPVFEIAIPPQPEPSRPSLEQPPSSPKPSSSSTGGGLSSPLAAAKGLSNRITNLFSADSNAGSNRSTFYTPSSGSSRPTEESAGSARSVQSTASGVGSSRQSSDTQPAQWEEPAPSVQTPPEPEAPVARPATSAIPSPRPQTMKPPQLQPYVNERKSSHAHTGLFPVCTFCDEEIMTKAILQVQGMHWHQEHFNCVYCNLNLLNESFHVMDGQLYCREHYQEIFLPMCCSCGKTITGNYIERGGEVWHPEHFCCAHCNTGLEGKPFVEWEGLPYCHQDFMELFGPKCYSCNKVIVGSNVDALGHKYHPNCFNCKTCNRSLLKEPCFEHEGNPFCADHYYSISGNVCFGCNKVSFFSFFFFLSCGIVMTF